MEQNKSWCKVVDFYPNGAHPLPRTLADKPKPPVYVIIDETALKISGEVGVLLGVLDSIKFPFSILTKDLFPKK